VNFISALQAYPALGMACALILGLLVGSFLNVVIYRLPKIMERDWQNQCKDFLANDSDIATLPTPTNDEKQEPFNLMVPASRCPCCNHKIRAWENIPVISYLFLGGKCSNCKTSISVRYPTIDRLFWC
jgi:leader peptidase (prepilin peptidase)/N-methyltransferase